MRSKKFFSGCISRKAKLIAALALSGCILISGCGGGGEKKTDAGKAGEKTFVYGTMAYGVAMENVGTDPHDTYVGWSTLRYGIGETLFRFTESMELEPWLAKNFERIDENTVKINLKEKIKFSNGKKVTGKAVKACLERLLKMNDRAPRDLKIASIDADETSVTIKTTEPSPSLINYLSDPYGCIIDTEADVKDKIVVGTGPYKAVKVTDTQIDLVKNENYWGDVKPKMDKITIRSITDGDTLTMAMQNGELDAVQGLPYASLELFGDTGKYKISQADTSRIYQIAFNYKTPELQDIKVRQAISSALDKENFTKVLLHGQGTPAVGPFPAAMTFGDKAVSAMKFDKDRAKSLLQEAGYVDTDNDGYVDKDGKNLELRYLTYTSRQELPLLAEAMQASLKEIGIKLNVNATDNYKAVLKTGDYDMYAKAFVAAPTGDPEYYFTTHVLDSSAYNNGFYHSDAIEALGRELHNEFNPAERSNLAIKMEQQLLDDCALIYASHLRMSFVMRKNIEGFVAHPSDYYEISPALDKKI